MKKQEFLISEKKKAILLIDDMEVLLHDVEQYNLKKLTETAANIQSMEVPEKSIKQTYLTALIERIKKKALNLTNKCADYFEGLTPQERSELERNDFFPALSPRKQHLVYEMIDSNWSLYEATVNVQDEYLIEAAVLLKKAIEKLNRSVNHIIRQLNAIVVDKRAHYRSMVKLLFKNMDDEHSAVNNTVENNTLNYLRLKIRYGTRTYQEIKANALRLAGARG